MPFRDSYPNSNHHSAKWGRDQTYPDSYPIISLYKIPIKPHFSSLDMVKPCESSITFVCDTVLHMISRNTHCFDPEEHLVWSQMGWVSPPQIRLFDKTDMILHSWITCNFCCWTCLSYQTWIFWASNCSKPFLVDQLPFFSDKQLKLLAVLSSGTLYILHFSHFSISSWKGSSSTVCGGCLAVH